MYFIMKPYAPFWDGVISFFKHFVDRTKQSAFSDIETHILPHIHLLVLIQKDHIVHTAPFHVMRTQTHTFTHNCHQHKAGSTGHTRKNLSVHRQTSGLNSLWPTAHLLDRCVPMFLFFSHSSHVSDIVPVLGNRLTCSSTLPFRTANTSIQFNTTLLILTWHHVCSGSRSHGSEKPHICILPPAPLPPLLSHKHTQQDVNIYQVDK